MNKNPKVVILAGGLGTRLSEETVLKPKPMVEIGGKPILWHIMKIYSSWGFNEFIICLGYKGHIIKDFFYNYFLYQSDLTVHLSENTIKYHNTNSEPWVVHLVDTGSTTMTGGRVKCIKNYIKDDHFFLLTYGDAVADLNIQETITHHLSRQKLATLTAVRPPARFGNLTLEGTLVKSFIEKSKDYSGFVNGGFFVLSPRVIDYIANDQTVWEEQPLTLLSEESQLEAYVHRGFWQPMDTIYEKNLLEQLWMQNCAPWKVW